MAVKTPTEARKIKGDPQSTSTRALVTFYTWPENGFSGRSDQAVAKKTLGVPVSVLTEKSFGSASGSFTITMKKPEGVTTFNYEKLWKEPEGVWVFIQWYCDGVLIDGTIGIIDSVNAQIRRDDGGARSETYEIFGRDFGKVFEETLTYINPHLERVDKQYFVLVDALAKIAYQGGTPTEIIQELLKAWIGNSENNQQPWELPPGLAAPKRSYFYGLLSQTGLESMTSLLNGATNNPRFIADDQDGTTLWDLMQQYANGVLNEFWVDLAPSKGSLISDLRPTIFLRERPFPTKLTANAKWNNLMTWKLKREDIRGRQVAKGGAASRYNYWILNPQGFGESSIGALINESALLNAVPFSPGAIPIRNDKSIRRHGIRKWEEGTIFIPGFIDPRKTPDQDAAFKTTGTASLTWFSLLAQWLQKIHDWYVTAPQQLSGSITTSRVFPEIRIGHRIQEETADGPITYYVEGVAHAWTYPGTGSTTLTVTRGEYEGSTALDDVYQDYAVQTRVDIGEIITSEQVTDDAALSSVNVTIGDIVVKDNSGTGDQTVTLEEIVITPGS